MPSTDEISSKRIEGNFTNFPLTGEGIDKDRTISLVFNQSKSNTSRVKLDYSTSKMSGRCSFTGVVNSVETDRNGDYALIESEPRIFYQIYFSQITSLNAEIQ